MDVIDRSYIDEPNKTMRNALCLLCHSPFPMSLSMPLSTPNHFYVESHRYLKAKGWSEFSEVEEIAKEAQGEERGVQSTLLFSSFSHINDEVDAKPRNLFKWRCTLCSLDVAVFPSSISLRFFALRHLEREHPLTFNDNFYAHEWSLLQIETSLVNMRRYSQNDHIRQQGRPIDITDPSDFLFGWQRSLRVPSPEYFTCGHCFFVSTEAEIRDHLAGHGLVAGQSAARIIVEDGGREAMIDEKTIRMIKKGLSVPSSILYGECPSREEERESEGMEEGEARPSTPANTAQPIVALTETPKSKYPLRARSRTPRYTPIEESTNNEDSMSSEVESDSGLEKNYETMSGDEETTEETGEEEEEEEVVQELEEIKPLRFTRVPSSEKKKTKTNSANTCTESSIAFDDVFDNGLGVGVERGEESMRRERKREWVHEKAFRWEGDAPPQLTAEQIELIREFKEGGRCSLCPRTKGYRGVGRMTNVERSLFAHLILNHPENGDARAVVTRKRYLLAMSIEAGGTEPMPPFLLQSVHTNYLTCSRCMDFKCLKQSNLVVHWEMCSGVRGNRGRTANMRSVKKEEEDEGMEEEKRVTPKRVMRSVRCPLCREGWKKSTHYSDDVSVAIHLLLKHTTDQQAYTMAMQLEEETNLQSSYPFIHLSDSFALRAEQPDSGIQCALCSVNSPTLASAIRHATRYHASAKEKEQANFTPGPSTFLSLSCPLPSSSCSIRSILLGRPRSIPAVYFLHVLFNHGKTEKEARKFMKEFNQEETSQLRMESNLRLDVEKTVQSWLDGSPRLWCSLCSHSSTRLAYYAKHFDDNDCGSSNDRLRTRTRSLLSKETTPLVTPRTPADVPTVKRGRGKAPEAGMNCAHCDRVVYASCAYEPSISMDIHLMKMHPKEKTTTPSSTFPFIDFSRSSADDLQCSLCEYSAKESRYILPHAWTKHTEESQLSRGMAEWAEFEMSVQRKREKQRISCARPMKRLREKMREKEERGEEEQEMRDVKRRRIEEEEEGHAPPIATAHIRTPRQRSAVSRWLDTSLADTSTYSPSTVADLDLRERLDKLFSCNDAAPSTPQTDHASSSIFKELPASAMSQMASQGRAEDISHIKGIEGVRCSVCSFKGRDTESLRIHFNEAHQEVSSLMVPSVFPCAACSRVFNSKKKWRLHCEEDHTPKERPFQCSKCEYRYETHQKLRAHQIRVHESEIMVHPDDRTCRECRRLFGSLRAFQNHKKRHEERERIAQEEG
ncbi:hypothetical protein PMAYCL1PPCAC_11989 [Pristionchus mayeri]|uniref:C2H2-type domain-containing protein n=1 Tax=Pristionchus mayeri TaxID=1317129 RepID=A0AAN5CFV4_9BILA|nr:hypothetical protein PMAYCL1PPCAC_11989 [Pristionchus mayeri]